MTDVEKASGNSDKPEQKEIETIHRFQEETSSGFHSEYLLHIDTLRKVRKSNLDLKKKTVFESP